MLSFLLPAPARIQMPENAIDISPKQEMQVADRRARSPGAQLVAIV
jgi:hypothetical protein